jgi:hypothetical protein
MGKAQRTKGHNFERKIVNMVNDTLAEYNLDEIYYAQRGLQARDGKDAADCGIFNKYSKKIIFHMECKKQNRPPNIKQAMLQAEKDKDASAVPCGVTCEDRQPIYVTMKFDDWMRLVATYLFVLCLDMEAIKEARKVLEGE